MSDLDPATDSRLADLAKQLPFDAPDDARREAVRASLLQAVRAEEAAPRRSWGLAGLGFVAGALAAAAVAMLLVRSPASSSAPVADHGAYATVESSNAVALEHVMTPTATGTLETVRVRDGKLRLAIPAVRDGDRVQLATRDAQVEGAGAFEVEVVDDSLRSVTVARGTARVVVAGQAPVFLATGQTWRAPIETADLSPALPSPADVVALAPASEANDPPVATEPAAPSSASPTSAPSISASPRPANSGDAQAEPSGVRTPRPAPTDSSNRAPAIEIPPPTQPPVTVNPPAAPVDTGAADIVEDHFQAGWKHLRAGKYAEAAQELGTAAAGEGPLAADALYFQAQALIKISRGTEAERALVAFLDRSPTSPRRGRAVVTLARLLAQRGDTASARTWYESVADDKDPAVQAAAKQGLSELDK